MQRVLRFVRYLVRMNWQPIIMTVQDGDYPAVDESLVEQIPPECVVYRTPVAEPYQLYRRFTGKKKDEKLPTYILSKKKNEGITDRVARWVRGNIFVPDARIGWIPYGVSHGKRIIAEQQPDLIFATSPPHSLQLIAKRLAAYSDLPWVADFRDPWTEAFWADDVGKTALVRKLDAYLEKSVLRTCNAATTVSTGIAEMFSTKVPNHYAVVQNGCEPVEPVLEKQDVFRLLFIGHLSKHQNPETLFAAAAGLPEAVRKDLEFCFVGRIFEGFADIFERYQQQLRIDIRGYMDHRALMDFAQSASVLLRPIARTSYAATSVGAKTSEYLSLRRPILTLGEKNSFSETMLSETRSGELFAYDDVAGIADFMERQHRLWREKGFLMLDNLDALEPYTTRYNVEKLVELFERLT